MKVDLCVIDNIYIDENYFEEFCEYHYNLGIDTIWLLDDVNKMPRTLFDLEYVRKKIEEKRMNYIPIKNHPNQHIIYPWFYDNYGSYFDWCCLFDGDEFLRLPKHDNIKDYLNDPELGFNDGAEVIQVSWLMYGDNGHVKKPIGSVIENYRHNPIIKDRIENKIIIKGGLENVETFIGHCAIANGNLKGIRYSNGEEVGMFTPFREKPDYSVAALDHFFTKSTEEFCERKSHGRLDIQTWSRVKVFLKFMEEYYKYNEKTEEKEKMIESYALKIIQEDKDSAEDFEKIIGEHQCTPQS